MSADAPLRADYPHATETIGTVRQVYDGALTPDLAVATFRNIDRLFPTRAIAAAATPTPLPLAGQPLTQLQFSAEGRAYDLYDFLALNRVAGNSTGRKSARRACCRNRARSSPARRKRPVAASPAIQPCNNTRSLGLARTMS